MSEWLNLLIGLSVAGSSILILTYFITFVPKVRINAKWHYLNRKLSLFLFLTPVFIVFESMPIPIFKEENQFISFIPIVDENPVWFTASFVKIMFAIWVIGVIATSLWFLYCYLRFKKRLETTLVPVPKESIIQHLLNKEIEDMKLKRNVDIAFSQSNISPVLIRIFKPTIVIPMYAIPYDELIMIIRHELTHYKKKDLWIKKLMLVATIVHWYNPFIHFLRKEVHKWSELSCDEDVVMKMSHSERKIYGNTILNMIERSNQELIPSFLGASFSTEPREMKNRLNKILKVKKENKLIIVLSVTILLVLGTMGVVSSALTHENAPKVAEIIEEIDEHLPTPPIPPPPTTLYKVTKEDKIRSVTGNPEGRKIKSGYISTRNVNRYWTSNLTDGNKIRQSGSYYIPNRIPNTNNNFDRVKGLGE